MHFQNLPTRILLDWKAESWRLKYSSFVPRYQQFGGKCYTNFSPENEGRRLCPERSYQLKKHTRFNIISEALISKTDCWESLRIHKSSALISRTDCWESLRVHRSSALISRTDCWESLRVHKSSALISKTDCWESLRVHRSSALISKTDCWESLRVHRSSASTI